MSGPLTPDPEVKQVTTKQIVVRGVDRDLWRSIRGVAVLSGLPVGVFLNHVLQEWVDQNGSVPMCKQGAPSVVGGD